MTDRMKILVVDDDRRMVKTICDVLNIKGYETLSAYSGEEAVGRVEADAPDCVMMDIKMPGINGVEAFGRIKAIDPDLPVVLMSAYASPELMEEGRGLGAYAVLTKPINFQQVLSFLSMLQREQSVLVVDDDRNFCRTLEDILKLRGFHVETVNRSEEALNALKDNHKDTVILDLRLGETDGVEVLKAIRQNNPSLPVILVTGYRQEMAESIDTGLTIGAYTCLYKPIETSALIETLEELWKKRLHGTLDIY